MQPTGQPSVIEHLACFSLIADGKLLLQCRSAEKITFPLYWANTCCSHPLDITGETDIENDIGVKR